MGFPSSLCLTYAILAHNLVFILAFLRLNVSKVCNSSGITVSRAACLPLSPENRAELIAAAPIPKALHGCELTAPELNSLTKLRTVVLGSEVCLARQV